VRRSLQLPFLALKNMMSYSPVQWSFLLLVLALAAGCGSKDEAKAPTTQVAAKVNAEEITVHQVNAALARIPNIPPEAADRAKREILGRLIDQQIAKRHAIENKLDRKPEVMQAIESARNEILSRAYLDSVSSALPRPTPEEVKKYYSDHPELFARRRIFNLQELVVQQTEGLVPKLEAQVAKSRTIEEVATWLSSQKIRFTANRGTRAAEALPLALVPVLQTFKDGEMRVVVAGSSLNVFRVVASQSAPVDESTATPRIQQFLFNQRATTAIAAEMKKLKDQAEIIYAGEFAENADSAEAKKKEESEAKQQSAAKAKAAAEAEEKARAEAKVKMAADSQAKAEALAKAREERLAEENKAKAAAAAKAKPVPSKSPQVQQESIEKGLRGLVQ